MESLESLQSSVTNPLIPALGQELLSNTDPTNSLLGFSTGSTQSVGLIDPIVEPGLLPVELTATNFTATNFNVMDSLTLQESQSSSSSIDPLLGNSLGVNVNSAFDSGVFTVGATGKVSFDFLLDGGVYQGELAIFSLEGMDKFELGSEAFIQEASRRALSDSDSGHVVISDLTEGARFHGLLGEGDYNSGIYQGVKAFSMRPGDEFGLMIVPDATVQQVFNNPFFDGAMRPLFSLSTANPNDAFQMGQIADVTGDGSTFVMEDLRVDSGSDKDYNDFIFQVRGATGKAVGLDGVIDPAKDWRGTDLGQALIEYAKPYVTPDNPSVGELVSDDLINTVFGTDDNSVIEGDDSGTIAPVSIKPEVTVAEVSTETAGLTSSEAETISTTQPLVEEAVVTPNPLVNEWLTNISKDLASIEASNNQMLEQFESELVEADNNLSNLANNFWDKYNSAQSETLDQLSNTWSALNNTQTSLNQLNSTISSSVPPISDQVNSLWSYINSREDTAINSVNGLHTAISNANSQMSSLYSNLVNEFNRNGGTYDEVWKQVYALNDYTSNEIGKDWGEYNTLKEGRRTLFNNTWSEYNNLKDYTLTARDNAWNQYKASANVLTNAWSQYVTLRDDRTTILDNTRNEYYDLNNQHWQVMGDAWSQYHALENSWNEWVADTKDEIKTWAKVLSDSEALFSGTETPWLENPQNSLPKVGLPLVGIIDTGFAADNPDIDYSRITLGKDLIGNDDNPLLESEEWWRDDHGTKILEVIAATRNNEIGIDGINDKSPLWLGSAVGSKNWAQSLVEFVDAAKKSGQPNAVVNLSFDLTQTNPDGSVTTRYELTSLERAALTYAQRNNVLIVAAAGNQGGTMSALGQAVKEFDNIITVGAAEGWNRANYSSYGEVDYDNYGKGVDILAQGNASNGASGSSVAAAKVTGAASLMWAANPNLNYTQVIDILRRTATDLDTPGWDVTTGLGLLNIAAAVFLAKATEPEVYTPRGFDLVQDTLKTYNVPEVYWPEFYKAYYYYDLEAKLGKSAWAGADGGVATERATAEPTKEKKASYSWVETGLGKFERKVLSWLGIDLPSLEETAVDLLLNDYIKRHPRPHPEYQSYSIERQPWSVSGEYLWQDFSFTYGGEKTLYLVTDWDEKARQDAKQAKIKADLAKVNAIKEKLKALEKETQKKIDALKSELAAVEAALKQESTNALGGLTAKGEELKKKVEELKAKLTGLQAESQKQLDALKSDLETAEENLRQSTQEYEAAIADAKARMQQKTDQALQELASSKKGFFDGLSDSVKQFSKDLGEQIKSNLKGVDVGAVLAALKKIPVVGTVVNGIEGLIALVQGDWKQVVKSGINGVLDIIPGGSAVPEKLVNILVDVGWTIVDKDYEQGLKDILKELEVGNKVANTFVDVAWAMKDGDWKSVLDAGLSGAGFSNADKFVDIAWGVKDGDYTKALTAGLEVAGLDKLGIDKAKADAFVASALALRDNQSGLVADKLLSVAGTNSQQLTNSPWVQALKNSDPTDDQAALSQGLSAVGFNNVEQWVSMAWDVKDKKYLNAVSTGFSLAGFTQGKDWVDMAWKLQEKNPDYFGLLSTGFKVAGFSEGEHLAKAAIDLRKGDYLDAFFEGMYMVPGVGDLVNAFKAVGDGDFKGVANSLAKVATNEKLLTLLVN